MEFFLVSLTSLNLFLEFLVDETTDAATPELGVFISIEVLILGALVKVSLATRASFLTEAILATLEDYLLFCDFANVSPPADYLLDFTSKFVVS